MKVIALVSGGKDSCLSMMECIACGHEIVALANLHPPATASSDEMDSYMYQTVGHTVLASYGDALGVPLYRRAISGGSANTAMVYTPTANDEVEDLRGLLQDVLEAHPDATAVASGAILSDYQRTRVEHVVSSLGLSSLAYLWRRDQASLLDAMVGSGIHAILVKIAAMGLDVDNHLGHSLAQVRDHLFDLNSKYGSHICGEGGEYETLTLDAPIFVAPLAIQDSQTIVVDPSTFAPVAHMAISDVALGDPKDPEAMEAGIDSMRAMLQDVWETEESALAQSRSLPDTPSPESISAAVASAPLPPAIAPQTTGAPDDGSAVSVTTPPVKVPSVEGKRVVALQASSTRIQRDGEGNVDVASAVDEIMGAIGEALTALGATFADVVLTGIFACDLNLYGAINKAYAPYFGVNPPARAALQIPLQDDELARIEMWVAVNETKAETLHVQSISHWAPANIGPYSQVKDVDGTLFMAGQIGMRPRDLSLPSPLDPAVESSRIVHHIDAVLQVMKSAPDALVGATVWANELSAGVHTFVASTWAGYASPAAGLGGAVVALSPFLPKNASLEVQALAVRSSVVDSLDPGFTPLPLDMDGLEGKVRAWVGADSGQDHCLAYANLVGQVGNVETVARAAAVMVAASPKEPSLLRIYLPSAAMSVSALHAALLEVGVGIPVSIIPTEGVCAVFFDEGGVEVPGEGVVAVFEMSCL